MVPAVAAFMPAAPPPVLGVVVALLPAVAVPPVVPAVLPLGVPVVPALGVVVSPPVLSPPHAWSATVATSSDPPSKFESDLRYIP